MVHCNFNSCSFYNISLVANMFIDPLFLYFSSRNSRARVCGRAPFTLTKLTRTFSFRFIFSKPDKKLWIVFFVIQGLTEFKYRKRKPFPSTLFPFNFFKYWYWSRRSPKLSRWDKHHGHRNNRWRRILQMVFLQ